MTTNLYIVYDITHSGYFPSVFTFLAVTSIIFAISVITIRNPVISILFLIGLFFSVAGYLIIAGLCFIALSYLLVYVGAVSILFLFILMLINIRISELSSDTRNSIPLVFLVAVLFENASYIIFQKSLLYDIIFTNYNQQLDIITSVDWEDKLLEFTHISTIGNVMYTNLAISLILASVILLLAMVGAIVITLKQKRLNITTPGLYKINN